MPDSSPARPPNLTLALLFIAFTSALLLVNVGGTLMSWTSLDLQESLREALDDAGIRDAGLSASSVITTLRVLAYVLVPVSVAGVVLAVFALRGHRGSRLPLTILCGLGALLFLVTVAASVVSLIPAALLVACAVALWSPDARRWFAAKNGQVDPTRPALAGPPSPVAGPDREEPTTSSPTTSLPSEADRPDAGRPGSGASGEPSGWPAYPGQEPQQPASEPPHPPYQTASASWTGPSQGGPPSGLPWQAPDQPSRPGAVWGAAITAGICSLLTLGLGLLLVLAGSALREPYRQALEDDPDFRRQLADSSLTVDQLLDGFLIGGVVVAVLALLGLIAALAYVLRWPGGLVALCVMSGFAIVSVITCVGALVAIPAVVVLVLALRGDARAWSRRR